MTDSNRLGDLMGEHYEYFGRAGLLLFIGGILAIANQTPPTQTYQTFSWVITMVGAIIYYLTGTHPKNP